MKTYVIFLFSMLLMSCASQRSVVSLKSWSADPDAIDIKRESHKPPRQRIWSGAGLSGELIKDPHFISTKVKFAVNNTLNNVDGFKYQGVDINPWFEKKYYEAIIAIEDKSTIYEYRIDDTGINTPIFANNYIDGIYALPYNDEYAFLLDSIASVVFISTPFEKGVSAIKPFSFESSRVVKLINFYKTKEHIKMLKTVLCESQSNSVIAFYKRIDPSIGDGFIPCK